ncbi:MAG: dUTP diphosphatase [Myxococcota bacterium]
MIRPLVQVLPLPGRPTLPLPGYATAGAAGLDLAAAESVTLAPGAWKAIGTGLALDIPEGYEGQVRPRSGWAAKHGVTVLNSPGTVDSDYRGEVKVILINHGPSAFEIQVGDRIAQLVVAPMVQAEISLATSLPDTQRGSGGFGSTGR